MALYVKETNIFDIFVFLSLVERAAPLAALGGIVNKSLFGEPHQSLHSRSASCQPLHPSDRT